MALEGIDGVAGAMVDKKLELFLSKDVQITADKLNSALKAFKITASGVIKSASAEF